MVVMHFLFFCCLFSVRLAKYAYWSHNAVYTYIHIRLLINCHNAIEQEITIQSE